MVTNATFIDKLLFQTLLLLQNNFLSLKNVLQVKTKKVFKTIFTTKTEKKKNFKKLLHKLPPLRTR